MSKKKIILYSLGAVVVLFFVAVIAAALAIDSVIKSTVETVGPRMTQTDFTLKGVDIRLLSGAGKLNGLSIGNPEKYSSEFAIKIEETVLDLHPGTLFQEKLVVESIQVIGPEITFEGGRSENNLKEIAANIGEFIGSPDEREQLDRKLQVNHFLLANAKVHLRLSVLGNKEITFNAPIIELNNLGMGPDGVTSAELTELVIKKISGEVSGMITAAVLGLGRSDDSEGQD